VVALKLSKRISVLHVVKTLASTFRRVMSQKFGRDHNSTTTSRLCMYRWDRFMFWTGGGVEFEPSQSVLRVLQRLAWTCSTRYVAEARPQLTFPQ
jgi:hypothetical protein